MKALLHYDRDEKQFQLRLLAEGINDQTLLGLLTDHHPSVYTESRERVSVPLAPKDAPTQELQGHGVRLSGEIGIGWTEIRSVPWRMRGTVLRSLEVENSEQIAITPAAPKPLEGGDRQLVVIRISHNGRTIWGVDDSDQVVRDLGALACHTTDRSSVVISGIDLRVDPGDVFSLVAYRTDGLLHPPLTLQATFREAEFPADEDTPSAAIEWGGPPPGMGRETKQK